MEIIKPFDPWKSPLCTCPQKYSFNPYTGCSHRCIYCYATYIPNFYLVRRKKNLIQRVKKDLEKIPKNSIISISNSSDPYLIEEEKYQDFKNCLQVFKNYDLRILIITKSDLILRDLDLLRELRVAATFTITSLDPKIYKKLEPFAPPPEKRLKAIEKLSKFGIKTGLRLDPIFLYSTDGEIKEIIKEAKSTGISHLVTSTFKPKRDSWLRFEKIFPKVAKKLKPLYFKKGERRGNCWYLPKEIRKEIIMRVKKECQKYKISFASCREGFPELHTSRSCDGSHLIDIINNEKGI
jgi:DNA repair photolyase